jgi:hypothetical protein
MRRRIVPPAPQGFAWQWLANTSPFPLWVLPAFAAEAFF